MIILVYCIVSQFNCMFVLSPALRDIIYTARARYSLFVLKAPLNSNKPNKNYRLRKLSKLAALRVAKSAVEWRVARRGVRTVNNILSDRCTTRFVYRSV